MPVQHFMLLNHLRDGADEVINDARRRVSEVISKRHVPQERRGIRRKGRESNHKVQRIRRIQISLTFL